MSVSTMTVLAVGATGSIGQFVVDEVIAQGHRVRALTRRPERLRPRDGLDVIAGDLTRPHSLIEAVTGIDAIVFTHGTYGSIRDAETTDYGGVLNILTALGETKVRIALMTAIAVTDRKGAHDWKRRAERLVRASGNSYTIVRPGWFDYNDREQQSPLFLQGDRRQSGTPKDGVISRLQVARVLVRSLTSSSAVRRTFELVAQHGPAPVDFDRLFAAIDGDPHGVIDGVHDADNMVLDREPEDVRATLCKSLSAFAAR